MGLAGPGAVLAARLRLEEAGEPVCLLACVVALLLPLAHGRLTWEHTLTQEAKLNSFPNFMMEVGGINLHFIHERSQHADAIPLLLLHGWPGSFWEFHKIIPMLTRPGDETLCSLGHLIACMSSSCNSCQAELPLGHMHLSKTAGLPLGLR